MGIDNLEIPRIGDILRDEFLDPLNITAYRLAKDLQVATSTILDILSTNENSPSTWHCVFHATSEHHQILA